MTHPIAQALRPAAPTWCAADIWTPPATLPRHPAPVRVVLDALDRPGFLPLTPAQRALCQRLADGSMLSVAGDVGWRLHPPGARSVEEGEAPHFTLPRGLYSRGLLRRLGEGAGRTFYALAP